MFPGEVLEVQTQNAVSEAIRRLEPEDRKVAWEIHRARGEVGMYPIYAWVVAVAVGMLPLVIFQPGGEQGPPDGYFLFWAAVIGALSGILSWICLFRGMHRKAKVKADALCSRHPKLAKFVQDAVDGKITPGDG